MSDSDEDSTKRLERAERTHVLAFWPDGSARFELVGDEPVVIGRSSECTWSLDEPTLSRHHACIHPGSPRRIEDLASANGTFVNGVRADARVPIPIPPGSTVELGPVVLVFPTRRRESHAPPEKLTMAEITALLDRVAPRHVPLTLAGEHGVGKRRLAQRAHALSPRSGGPFRCVDCSGEDPSALLFGVERDDGTLEPGLLEASRGGTCVLEEVGELDDATQQKLLRAIEQNEVLPVGSLRPRRVDVRWIATSTTDSLHGALRPELYYALCGVFIRIPSLRERPEDIETLTTELLAELAEEHGRAPSPISPSALELLIASDWPGNVRQLQHALAHAQLVAGEDVIEPAHLPDAIRPDDAHGELRQQLGELERRRIEAALERADGNQTKAARLLGMPRRTLISRLEAYGFPRPRKRPKR